MRSTMGVMASPFPGVDPYVEGYFWRDFHTQFIVAMRRALRRQISHDYDVFSEHDVFVHEPTADERRRKVAVLDAGVTRASNATVTGGVATATKAVAEPSFVARYDTEMPTEKHRWLEIRDRAGSRLVTAIELLSPTNKESGKGMSQYLNKRREFLDSAANFIEIDLLRGGRAMPLDPEPVGPYSIALRRGHLDADAAPEAYGEVAVWDVGLRRPLPTIPVPLAPPDADVPLDLQALLHATYAEADYGPRLYDHDLDPPLDADDAAWAAGLLREARQLA